MASDPVGCMQTASNPVERANFSQEIFSGSVDLEQFFLTLKTVIELKILKANYSHQQKNVHHYCPPPQSIFGGLLNSLREVGITQLVSDFCAGLYATKQKTSSRFSPLQLTLSVVIRFHETRQHQNLGHNNCQHTATRF